MQRYFDPGIIIWQSAAKINKNGMIWFGTGLSLSGEAMRFGPAVELSAAIPLSWVPLISDYTREAKSPGLPSY